MFDIRKMPDIVFIANTIKDYDPDLVSSLRQITSLSELNELYDIYDSDEIAGAMLAIAHEEGADEYDLLDRTISDSLWRYFYEYFYGNVCEAFLHHNQQRQNANNASAA